MKKYKVGVIGTGFGEEHIKLIKQIPNFEIKWLGYRSNSHKAQEIADKYDIPNITNHPQTLFSEVDYVVIVTPLNTHYQYAKEALETNIMVLCDKPLALNSVEAQKLVQLAQEKKLKNMIFFHMRFNKHFRKVKNILDKNLLGNINFVKMEFYHDFFLNILSPTWRYNLQESGSGAISDMGVHLIDLVNWLFKDTIHIDYVTKKRIVTPTKKHETEDYCNASFHLKNKKIDGTLTFSRVTKDFQFIQMIISGENGTVLLQDDLSKNVGKVKTFGFNFLDTSPEIDPNPYRYWLQHLEGDSIFSIPTFEDGFQANRVMDQIINYKA